MKKTDEIPEIEEKSKEELDEIIRIIKESSLPEYVKTFIIKCIESALWFPHILQKKNISMSRFKRMIFGKGYRNNKKAEPSKSSDPDNTDTTDDNKNNSAPESDKTAPVEPLTTSASIEASVNNDAKNSDSDDADKPTKPGHGRMPHTVYQDYKEINLTIDNFKVGDPCPQACGGRLYEFEPKKPRVLVRIKGQNFADVHKYIVQRLRCNLCDLLIQANIPDEVGKEKYDASFKAWLVLQKYFVAVPFYRQEIFQRMLKFPLPDATQWDLVEQAAGSAYAVFHALITHAANGELIHQDDTTVRIQEIIKEIKNNPDAKRTGMFTSGFVATYENHKIALFLNGDAHAGENLEDILKKREKNKNPIIQMCDALNSNLVKEIETIICNCLSHGFRKFEEIEEHFPTPCITIMKLLGQVYKYDRETKDMDDKQRLKHHKKNSRPVMKKLKRYLKALFNEKRVEPNSELGKAIKYLQRHWDKLTRFLSVAGAPLCNNVVERALKIAIRNRKSAMFYRTRYSAHIGGMLTSLIYTCNLEGENPHDYLVALQHYTADVTDHPRQWMPWNYQARLAQLERQTKPATARACEHSEDLLAAE